MPSLKEIRTKIASVKSTKRIMQAMKMIATVKYAKTQIMLNSFRPYFESYKSIVTVVSNSSKGSGNKFLDIGTEEKRCLLVIISSDRGLCGSYNSSLFRSIEKYEFPQQTIEKLFIGKKGQDYFKENSFGNEIFSADEKNYKSVSASISDKILLPFLNGEIDQIYVAYNKFASAISQLPTITKILPMEFEYSEDIEQNPDILIEPDIDLFIETVFPKFLNLTLSSFLLEAITSEHAARTAAMDNATRNADDIIRDTTMLFNKTRQAYITKELMDIVNGAEAMK
ncbi:MAG: ATP synthase F1 subunit gamma [Thermodesulfobacteriota bacterium]|nr:ATP synthase F1 subunit gamma [Thermodesulfobacteriota bacterium]